MAELISLNDVPLNMIPAISKSRNACQYVISFKLNICGMVMFHSHLKTNAAKKNIQILKRIQFIIVTKAKI